MISEMINIYQDSIKDVSFDATYKDLETGNSFDIMIAQKNTSVSNIDGPSFSVNEKIEYILPTNYINGFSVKASDALIISGKEYGIIDYKPLRMGVSIVSYIIEVSG